MFRSAPRPQVAPMAFDSAMKTLRVGSLAGSADIVSTPSQSELAPVKRVRKFFPETWLWKQVSLPSYVDQCHGATVGYNNFCCLIV